MFTDNAEMVMHRILATRTDNNASNNVRTRLIPSIQYTATRDIQSEHKLGS